MVYPVVQIQDDASYLYEQLGTKRKFWFDETTKLFKEGRPNTGENWAEVVASRICNLINIPHAHYDFALFKDRQGVVCASIVPEDGRLVHGNELLSKFDASYDREKRYKQISYTLTSTLAVLRKSKNTVKTAPGLSRKMPQIYNCLDAFIGYLMLDALIANQDRHHENWGFVVQAKNDIYLASTYDHASSLGRNESDNARIDRLNTRDKRRSIDSYAIRAKSAFYAMGKTNQRLDTVEAFIQATKQSPTAGNAWIRMLENIDEASISSIFSKVPRHLITKPAIDFATALILINKQRLLTSWGNAHENAFYRMERHQGE